MIANLKPRQLLLVGLQRRLAAVIDAAATSADCRYDVWVLGIVAVRAETVGSVEIFPAQVEEVVLVEPGVQSERVWTISVGT